MFVRKKAVWQQNQDGLRLTIDTGSSRYPPPTAARTRSAVRGALPTGPEVRTESANSRRRRADTLQAHFVPDRRLAYGRSPARLEQPEVGKLTELVLRTRR